MAFLQDFCQLAFLYGSLADSSGKDLSRHSRSCQSGTIIIFLLVGVLHLINPQAFVYMIEDMLPYQEAMVLKSGITEIQFLRPYNMNQMERFKILTEKPQDIVAVYELHREAFTRNDESNLVNRLRSSEEYLPELSLVAKTEKEELVGHIMFSKIIIKGKENFSSLSLAPMAVHPEYQKQNIGTALIKRGLDKATELNFTSVIVLGHPDYYPRFGFKPASQWGIKAPFEAPDNALLAMELVEGSLATKSGIVQYSPAFREI